MKILLEPPHQEFGMYIARADTVFAEREEGETLESIYASGFLPYSGAKGVQNVFYSARSARILLSNFSMTSENRRIAKKFDGQFRKEHIPCSQFKPDEEFYTFCIDYFAAKHGARAMPRERLETILNSGIISNTTIYRSTEKPMAYVLEVREEAMGHYWFSFYDLAYAKQSLGLWLMLDALRNAKKRGLHHYYLGTVYGEKALYKTNFEPLEWWDGEKWNDDVKMLRRRSRLDNR